MEDPEFSRSVRKILVMIVALVVVALLAWAFGPRAEADTSCADAFNTTDRMSQLWARAVTRQADGAGSEDPAIHEAISNDLGTIRIEMDRLATELAGQRIRCLKQ